MPRILLKLHRFLLSLEGKGREASFFVSKNDDTTAFLKAGYYPNAGPQMREVLPLLLKKFSHPEQLNARSARASKTAAIQAAIQASNASAVKLFIEAGADLTIKDHKDLTLIDLAIHKFHKEYQESKSEKKHRKDKKLDGCLEVISILSRAASWPPMAARSIVVEKLVKVTKGLIDIMMKVPHHISEQYQMHEILAQVAQPHVNAVMDAQDVLTLEDTRRQLERLLNPVFYVELSFIIVLTEHAAYPGLDIERGNDSSTKVRALELRPVLKELDLAKFSRLKDACLLECILEAERNTPFNSDRPYGEWGFWKFARSAKPEDLFYDHRYVTYPQSLLECWKGLILSDALTFDNPEDRSLVIRFIWTLRVRAKQLYDGIWPLQPYDREFTQFHFRDIIGLPDKEISATHLDGAPGVNWGCRCMRHKIGTQSREAAIELNEEMSKSGHVREPWALSSGTFDYYTQKAKQMETKAEQSQWKSFVLESAEFLQSRPETFLEGVSSAFEKATLQD